MPQTGWKQNDSGREEEIEIVLPPRLWRDVHLCRRRLERSMDSMWLPTAEMAIMYITLATLDDARIAAQQQIEDLPF